MHARLDALVQSARRHEAGARSPTRIGLVYPCNALALHAAQEMLAQGLAQPVLIGPQAKITALATTEGIDLSAMAMQDTVDAPTLAASHACMLVRAGALSALMKGSLHTDELMSAVVNKDTGLRTKRRISHAFLFDLPRYHKLLALADCVVNIAPDLRTKQDILANAVELLQALGISHPKVGIVAAVETPNASIPATIDAQTLVQLAREGHFSSALVEGPFGFDNAISAQAATIKGMQSQVAGDADLLIMPDLNAGNMLYKSFNYIGGGDCAGVVLGASVPIVLTSRADSLVSRIASVALAVLAAAAFSSKV
jgi:phosphate acetyltransferase